ncbi:hypothetical protein KEM54_002812 [Ascosphaera aggregata]|nr:hypothetical protein KEM54_002812 [Ascosphaera aggregata]
MIDAASSECPEEIGVFAARGVDNPDNTHAAQTVFAALERQSTKNQSRYTYGRNSAVSDGNALGFKSIIHFAPRRPSPNVYNLLALPSLRAI